jgi:hypothetical protein
MKLDFDSPQVSVFLRRLAWETNIAKKEVSVKMAIDEYVNSTRNDLGLKSYGKRGKSGGADDFIQKRYLDGTIGRISGFLELKNKRWKSEWRLLYLPSHGIVRQLSSELVVEDVSKSTDLYSTFSMSSRDPAIPTLSAYVADKTSFEFLQIGCKGKRGVYFLGHKDKGKSGVIYIGKTDEFEIRLNEHIKTKEPSWAVFLSLEEHSEFFTLDSLAASEGLLNYFWNEIIYISTEKRGSDRKPVFPFLQQAILFMEGVSACIIWFARENKITLPFKKWRGQPNWKESYLGKSENVLKKS